MNLNIEFVQNGYSYPRKINVPNICPHCASVMQPAYHTAQFIDGGKSIFGVLLRCTASDCNKVFALEYDDSDHQRSLKEYKIYDYRPPIKVELPENIEKVSETFVEVFSQANKAESEGLDQIAGVGYRKSLEFLIKDYAIRNNPDKEESIKKKMLGPVITEYLTDFPKLQNLARAATWIGNDETHYVRRHDDKDIRDMKQFIKSASQFIAADYDADLAEEFINE